MTGNCVCRTKYNAIMLTKKNNLKQKLEGRGKKGKSSFLSGCLSNII